MTATQLIYLWNAFVSKVRPGYSILRFGESPIRNKYYSKFVKLSNLLESNNVDVFKFFEWLLKNNLLHITYIGSKKVFMRFLKDDRK